MSFVTYLDGERASMGQAFPCVRNMERLKAWKLDAKSAYGLPNFKVTKYFRKNYLKNSAAQNDEVVFALYASSNNFGEVGAFSLRTTLSYFSAASVHHGTARELQEQDRSRGPRTDP